MSTCISRHGEFGSHKYGEGPERFVCQLCGVLDEDAMLAALTEAEAERDRLQAERDLQLSLSGDDWLRDQHARYHDEPGNMFGPGECGWDRCWFIEVATWVLNAPRPEAVGTVYDEIRAERERAHAKHGERSMESSPAADPQGRRYRILLEEIGEVANEFNEADLQGRPVDLAALRRELIQVAAMATAWADACGRPQ